MPVDGQLIHQVGLCCGEDVHFITLSNNPNRQRGVSGCVGDSWGLPRHQSTLRPDQALCLKSDRLLPCALHAFSMQQKVLAWCAAVNLPYLTCTCCAGTVVPVHVTELMLITILQLHLYKGQICSNEFYHYCIIISVISGNVTYGCINLLQSIFSLQLCPSWKNTAEATKDFVSVLANKILHTQRGDLWTMFFLHSMQLFSLIMFWSGHCNQLARRELWWWNWKYAVSKSGSVDESTRSTEQLNMCKT